MLIFFLEGRLEGEKEKRDIDSASLEYVCVLIVLVYVVCVYLRCGADGKYLPYLTLFIQTLLQRDLPSLPIPKNIIIQTCQLPTIPASNHLN